MGLQQIRYGEDRGRRQAITIMKAAEKEKKDSFAPWWSLLGIFKIKIPLKLIRSINKHMYLIIQVGPPGLIQYLGKYDKKSLRDFRKVINAFEKDEKDRAALCRELIDEIQAMLYNVGLYPVPPYVVDFEEPEEPDIYFPPRFEQHPGSADLTPPEPEPEEASESGEG